jgi:spore germination protein
MQGLFDIEELSEHVDSIIIMGYDIHTPSGSPGPIAPIEGRLSMLGFLQSYLEKVPAEKIILAVPYYGYDWEQEGVRENHKMLSYAEIIDHSKDKTILWEQNAQSPYYAYIDPETQKERIVHFENVRSLGAKYDLINTKNLKGVGIWALGYDGRNADLKNLLVEKFAR